MTKPHAAMSKPKRMHLKFVGLQPRTLRAYRLALGSFLKFIQRQSIHSLSPSSLDRFLAEFINHGYQEGDPISYAGHLLSAIKRFHPELRLKLPRASQYYRNWVKAYTPARALPASWELVEAMIAVSFDLKLPRLGVLLGLGFHCMLRTSEMMLLSKAHILLHPQGSSLSVVLPHGKTSEGNPQVLQVDDPNLVALARLHLQGLNKQTLLWTSGPHHFRETFDSLLRKLGFKSKSYLPYSLRRGGATWFYQTTLSLDATVTRGRWSCSKTARQYIDEGTAQLAHLTSSDKQVKAVRKWRLKGAKLRLRQTKKRLGLTFVGFSGQVFKPPLSSLSGLTEAFFKVKFGTFVKVFCLFSGFLPTIFVVTAVKDGLS